MIGSCIGSTFNLLIILCAAFGIFYLGTLYGQHDLSAIFSDLSSVPHSILNHLNDNIFFNLVGTWLNVGIMLVLFPCLIYLFIIYMFLMWNFIAALLNLFKL